MNTTLTLKGQSALVTGADSDIDPDEYKKNALYLFLEYIREVYSKLGFVEFDD